MSIVFLSLVFNSTLFANTLMQDIKPLIKSSFKIKQKVIENIVQKYSSDEKLIIILNSMLKGKLLYTKYKKQFVILDKKNGKIYQTSDLFTSKNLEVQKKRKFKKVKTNNKLRKFIKSKLAQLNLFSKDKNLRLVSAKGILSSLSKESTTIIQKAIQIEKDEDIKKILLEANYILLAKYSNGKKQLNAVEKLGTYLSPKALQILNEVKNDKTTIDEVKEMAIESIGYIQDKIFFYDIIEKAFFGLSLGSVLLLAALGLAITFGVMKVINMAHGEMIMIGAYVTYTLQQLLPNLIEYSVIIAIPVAFLVSAIVGIIIERLIIRHLYGRPLETLLATFGISLILQQLVRTIYSPLNQEVKTPQWMSGALEINDALSITYNRLYIIIFAFIIFLTVLLILKKTSLGLKVRAVTQNRQMAQAMGIKTGFIDAMTFGLGSGIAGVAGVALSQLTNVGPNLGQAYIVDSFMVVVFGGVGNLWGTLIAAISLGEINKFIEPVAGAVLAKVLILIFIILFIQKRPRGLFPQKGRDAQD
jgi:urea transport system permease protein